MPPLAVPVLAVPFVAYPSTAVSVVTVPVPAVTAPAVTALAVTAAAITTPAVTACAGVSGKRQTAGSTAIAQCLATSDCRSDARAASCAVRHTEESSSDY